MAEKKRFNLKAEHRNPNGGLNAKGRAAYNKATGSNLKAPQPEGGSRRDSFEKEMRIQAWLAAQHISDAKSLEPHTVLANLLTGPTTLYRVANSTSKAPPGIWWFTEKVAARCRNEAGPDRKSVV
jgi:hypothetical protein